MYSITSGGEELKPYVLPVSDIHLQVVNRVTNPLDRLYTQLRHEEPAAKTFYFALPGQADGVYRVSVVHKEGLTTVPIICFDRYTLVSLKGAGPYAGKYTEASPADKFRRMNLEIHDGRIWGLPGKIIMFLASLTGASLPVTGFIIWYRKAP